MEELSQYANGVGPAMGMIVSNESTRDNLLISSLVERAHASGLVVHPYTFRRDSGQVPDYAESFERLLEIFYFEADVDGLKTDFPDVALTVIQERQ
jgi:glycerophosphoryl diester phosphodiesterase